MFLVVVVVVCVVGVVGVVGVVVDIMVVVGAKRTFRVILTSNRTCPPIILSHLYTSLLSCGVMVAMVTLGNVCITPSRNNAPVCALQVILTFFEYSDTSTTWLLE